MITARRGWISQCHDYRMLKGLFDEDDGGDVPTAPEGFRIFRPITKARGHKRVQWGRTVINIYRRNMENGTRSPYPTEEVFTQSRGGGRFYDTPTHQAKVGEANRLRAMRTRRRVAREARRVEVARNAKKAADQAGDDPTLHSR